MAQFIAFDSTAKVNGQTVLAIVAGMGAFKNSAIKILKENGIDNPVPGKWYSQQSWLDAFKVIAEKIGAVTLFEIGKKIPESADWPPQVNDIESALASIDIAYHMNHMINGEALFNPNNGSMQEGIGHYGKPLVVANKKITMVCNNPYPCDFDRGIIESASNKFRPVDAHLVTVTHDDTQPCRKKGQDSCTYHINW